MTNLGLIQSVLIAQGLYLNASLVILFACKGFTACVPLLQFTHCSYRIALSWTFISLKAWLTFNVTVSVFVYSWSARRSLETWWSLLILLLPSVFTSEPMSPIRLFSALRRLDSSRRSSFMPRRFVAMPEFVIPSSSHKTNMTQRSERQRWL